MDYELIDADNHYYEAEDAFFRHGNDQVKRYVRWMQEGKKRHLFFGNNLSTGVANPTFNPIARAGAFHERLKQLEHGHDREQRGATKLDYGRLEPLPDAYRYRDARLDLMDEQGVEAALFFPTLGDCVEGLMEGDIAMAYAVFHAFNEWISEDWGFSYKDRIIAPPYIAMLDPQLAAKELSTVLEKGARAVTVRPGPAGGRSPADPAWDPFWSQINESGIIVCYHAFGGPTVYSNAFERMYGAQPVSDPQHYATLDAALVADRGIQDTVLSLVLGNLFGRFPNVRIASIEMGMQWVPYVIHQMDHAGGILERRIEAFGQRVLDRPSDIFKNHVYVSPFPEEDIAALVELIGADHVLFGSDWPHPEGNVQPADFATSIAELDEADIKRIMRDNALALVS